MNLRPLGPQPSALPSYAIPREQKLLYQKPEKKQPENIVRNIQKRKRTRRFRRSFQFFIKKNGPWHILAPRAVACDNLHLRASAHLWHVNAFLRNREFLGISSYIKKVPDIVFTMPGRNCSWCHPISQISLPRKPTAPCLRHSHSCRLHS